MKTAVFRRRTGLALAYLVAVILILLPFHALVTTWIGSNTGHLDYIRIWKEVLILAALPFAGWLLLTTPELENWVKKSRLFQVCAIYVCFHLVFGIWAYKHDKVSSHALIYALIINLRFVGIFLLALVAAAYHPFLKKIWRQIVILPGAVTMVFGLAQNFLLPNDFLKHFGYGPSTIQPYQAVDANIDFSRVQSTLRGANPFGAYLVIIVPAFLAGLRKKSSLWAILLLAALLTMFYTYSRSAWVGLALALYILSLLMIRRRKKEWLLAGVAAVVLGAGVLYGLRANPTVQDIFLHTSSKSASAMSSNEIRNQAIKQGFDDVVHDPIGRGPGTAGPASFRNNGHTARIAENYYLQIAQEVGVFGLLLFITINVLVARELWIRRADTLAQLLLASLVGISFINLVSHAWADDTLSLLWWGLAGIALAPLVAHAPKRPAQWRSR
jgi:hypothetical protein